MRNCILCLAAFLLAACSRDAGSPVPAPPVTTLAEVAEIMSELPYEREHLLEVYDAVGSSSGNGYDEEYMMADLFESPGAGVGDERAGTRAASYSRPIRELFAERLSSRLATRSGASGVEEYIGALSASDIQIYWPYSENWDGETLPIITYDPGYGAETNMGYVLEYGPEGAEVVDSVLVDEALAMTRPVWVINRNDDAGFTPLEMFLKSGTDASSEYAPAVSIVGGEDESRMLLVSTDFNLSQIAQILGFSSLSYFSQSFRRLEGISPMEYRKRNRSAAR